MAAEELCKPKVKEELIRTGMLFGEEGLHVLQNARVAVFGIGGVGGHVAEALARSGVGAIDLVDNDTVAASNLNRQIIATKDTIGMYKTEAMKMRIASINPDIKVTEHRCFFLPEEKDKFDFAKYSYIVDAVDTVTAKIALVEAAQEAGVPIISSMGTGNKLDPTRFEVTDIYKTSVCPLAKVMRKELKQRGIPSLKVVYSREEALTPLPEEAFTGEKEDNEVRRKKAPGSVAFVPGVAGLIIAGEVMKDIIKGDKS